MNLYGLHLRPAEKFVAVASKYQSDIRVVHNNRAINGKSILDLMTLAAECGALLKLEASGPDAESAIAALTELVNARFLEPDSYPAAVSPPDDSAASPDPSPTP